MKRLLRKLLTKGQYDKLSRLKNETLPNLRYRLGQSPFLLVGSVIKFLPDNTLVTLKSAINVVKQMDYARRDIFLNVDSDFEYRVRLHSCKKEPETVQWIETFFREGDVFYDIGANVGAYSLVASKFFEGKVTVYAFEPAFLNFTQLCKNLILNGSQESVVPLPIALSDKTHIANFNFQNLVPGGAIHALGEPVDGEGNVFTPVVRQYVLSYRVDELIKHFDLRIPNHIKIDVDGTEFSVLKGMDETLNDRLVRSMLLELNVGRGSEREILEFLANKGFEVHSKYGANHIFVRTA
jgi:FkbM family methyltransferase